VADDDNPVQPRQEDYLVGATLLNRGMPLIRFSSSRWTQSRGGRPTRQIDIECVDNLPRTFCGKVKWVVSAIASGLT